MRLTPILLAGLMALPVLPLKAEPIESFADFIRNFETKAVQAGISRETYRAAMSGVQPVSNIPGLVSSQPEFTTPMWGYIDQRVSAGRIARGRDAVAANRQLLEAAAGRYGVDPYILAAIWGMETDYGSVLGSSQLIRPIIPSLATLVHHRRGRLAEDEQELIAALRLIETQHWTAETLVGSWAGAVGHTQVIASGLLQHGTDGDGDGVVNPHASLADALATTARYLRDLGYVPGIDWGFEVGVPEGFDYTLATRTEMKPVAFFAERGVKRVLGREFADMNEPVFLYVPAGKDGPKFLMTRNYLVLKGYNFSDSYAMSVAHLTDRLKGAGPFAQAWPRETKFPNRQQRVEIQRWLKQLGYYDGEVDGRIGPITQEAYQKFQQNQGLVADGFVTAASHAALRRAVQ